LKIIGLSLPKTGTTSLQYELSRRGYAVAHGPYPVRLSGKSQEEQFDQLDGADALLEWIGLWPTKEVVDRWPDAIFINTPREYHSWLDSCRRHFRPSPSERVRRGRNIRFGVGSFQHDQFAEMYQQHCADMATLASQGVRIHNIHITAGETTAVLDGILKRHQGRPFPHKRKGRRR